MNKIDEIHLRLKKSQRLQDLFVLGLILAAVGISVYLYKDMTSKIAIDDKSLNKIGVVSFLSNDVFRRNQNSLVWNRLDRKDSIYFGDTVTTLEDSEAIIKISDTGSEIEIDPNSMIILEFMDDSFNLTFLRGKIYSNSSAMLMNVKYGDELIKANNSSFSFSNNEIFVLDGILKAKDKSIKEGYLATMRDSSVLKIKKNLFNIINPVNNEKILSPEREKFVKFKWEKLTRAKYVEIDISKDRDFKKVIYNKRFSRKSSFSKIMQEGVYYYRLKSGKTVSPVHKFSVIFEKPTRLVYPIQNAVERFRNEEPLVKFQWNASIVQDFFELEVSKDIAFNSIIFRGRYDDKIAKVSMSEGKFFYRIKSYNKYRKRPLISNVSNFEVVKAKELENPKLLAPINNKAFFSKLNPNVSITFSWKPVKEVSYYNIVIARDEKLKDTILVRNITNNNYLLAQPSEGAYYWTVHAVDEKGIPTKFKSPKTFRVINKSLIQAVEPVGNKKIVVKSKTEKITFKWAPVKRNLKYEVFVSKNSDLLDFIKIVESKKGQASFSGMDNGAYFWKVVEKDLSGDLHNISEVNNFLVEKYPLIAAPFLTYPNNGSSFQNLVVKTINFKWKSNKKAKKYIFSYYNRGKGKEKLVFRHETTKNAHKIKAPEIGKYAWDVTGIDAKGVPGNTKKRYFKIIPKKRLRSIDANKIDKL